MYIDKDIEMLHFMCIYNLLEFLISNIYYYMADIVRELWLVSLPGP